MSDLFTPACLYFFDDSAIQSMEGLTRTPGPIEKLGVVLQPDRPSDGQRCMSFAGSLVPLDDGRWRFYYSVSASAARMRGIAVAESVDGQRWEKPGLGQLRVDDEDTNRLAIRGLPEGVHSFGQPQVCRPADGRWRMYFWVNQRPYLRYTVAESADGVRWEVPDFHAPVLIHPLELGAWGWTQGVPPPEGKEGSAVGEPAAAAPATEGHRGHLHETESPAGLMRLKGRRTNDAVYVYQDPATGGYELYAPYPVTMPTESPRRVAYDNAPFMLRSIHRRTSRDGISWSDAELLITPDARDRLDQQFYYLAPHRQDGWRIGMLGSYQVHDQMMDIELCFSRDGRDWQRTVREPWVPRTAAEEAGMVYAPNRLLDAGEHWLLLYTASPIRHNEIASLEPGRVGAVVCAGRFPKRRFLALTARGTGVSTLWTRPFILGGREIGLDARIEGWLRAELCDPFGVPLAGFEKGRCRVVSGDHSAHRLRWEGSATAPYQYDAVSLRLEMHRGDLFNIHWD